MFRNILMLCAALSVTACATKPTPPLFQGSSGWKILPDTTKLVATEIQGGELIAEREVEFVRTGILKTDVKNMLGIVKMKAGSPVYAASYGGVPKTFSSLAWCAPATESKGLVTTFTGENDVECLMYNGLTGRAVRTDGNSTSRFFASRMTPTTTSIAVPEIEEGPVDFGRKFTLRLTAGSLSGKTLEAIQNFHDGEDQTVIRQTRLKFGEDDSVLWSVWGGQLKLTREGTEENLRLRIEEISPFTDARLTNAQMQQLLQSLLSQANKPDAVDN